jgi:membrane protein required for colicin V production
MNGLDLAVLLVLAISAAFAFARGFIREALSLLAWGGAAAIAIYEFDVALLIAERFIKTKLLAQFVTGAGLFLGSLIVLTVVTGLIARGLRKGTLSPIDRTVGLLFGVARGAVLIALAYLALMISLPQNDWPQWVKDAKSRPYAAAGAEMLRNLLPPSLRLKTAAAANETQELIKPYLNPAAPAPQGQPKPPVYPNKEQRDLGRVIENAH